jgi:signal transduction histidine kinase
MHPTTGRVVLSFYYEYGLICSMTLRRRTLFVVMVTLATLMVLMYAVADITFMRSIVELEQANAQDSVKKVRNIMIKELDELDGTAWDWAAWDDTYAFMEDGNEEYLESNLVPGTFTALRLNFMLYLDSSGQLVYGKAVNLESESEVPLPEGIEVHIAPGSPLLQHEDVESTVTGLIVLPEGPMLVASRPILTSEDEGPIRGTLIMGRALDATEIASLSKISHLNLSVQLLTDEPLPLEIQAAQAALSEEAPVLVQPRDDQTITGYILMEDLYGAPSLIVKTELTREIYEYGQTAMNYFIVAILVVGLIFIVLILVLLEFQVLAPLSKLSKSMDAITKRRDASERVPETGKDELLTLAEKINNMLTSLEGSLTELRSSEERYREKNRELEHFTYTVSHDLRSPLITIKGFANVLQGDLAKNDRERAKEDLQFIVSAVEKMDQLLTDTLKLSRIGRLTNPPADVPFGAIVQSALEQTAGALGAHKVKVLVAEDFHTVHVDRLRIEELLVNLITNSIKYRGENPQPQIEIECRREGDETVFCVSDNGIGIAESKLDKVFDLFYQGDKATEGTGAGLAIVKRIVEVHGGRIWIESEEGKGTTVCFTLPVR